MRIRASAVASAMLAVPVLAVLYRVRKRHARPKEGRNSPDSIDRKQQFIQPRRNNRVRDVTVVVTGLTAVATLIFNWQTIRQSQTQLQDTGRQLQIDQAQANIAGRAEVTGRFTAAVAQLGSPSPVTQMGAIFALRGLFEDSSVYQPSIVTILSAYIREHRWTLKKGSISHAGIRDDVQAALNVLASRRVSFDRWAVVNLEHSNLSGMSLKRAHFNRAYLPWANLSRSDLQRAELLGARLEHTSLIAAELQGANLSHALLNAADIADANLNDATLSNARLAGANLSGARLFHTNLTHAIMFSVRLSSAYLSGATMTGADLQGGANLDGATLVETILDDASMPSARLNHAQLVSAWLINAEVRKAQFRCTDLTGAHLVNADLRGADLRGARLISADLRGADLRGADLRDAVMIGAHMNGAKLKYADLRGVILPSGVRLGHGPRNVCAGRSRTSRR